MAPAGATWELGRSRATHRFQLYRSSLVGSAYREAEPPRLSDGSEPDVDPARARDQPFIVFGTGRHAKKDIVLFIAFRVADGWGAPIYLGDTINSPGPDPEPRLSPDNKTLHFSIERVVPVPKPVSKSKSAEVLKNSTERNNGLYNIWYVDLAEPIRQFRSAGAG